MKSSLVVFAIVTLVSVVDARNYEGLKAYKMTIKNQTIVKKSSALKQKVEYFVIDFKDINKMDTFSLEKKYALKLSQCIADGICIFKFMDAQTQQLNINKIISTQTNIKQIKEYKAYEFQVF